jgi:hypothetical protein
MKITRRQTKQTASLKDRLASFAKDLRRQALTLPPGAGQEDLLRRARRADTTAHLDDWINSPGLQPPVKSPRQTGPRRPA